MKTFLVLFIAGALVLSVGGRLLSHAPNFTPMGAFALFAGAYLAQKSRWMLFLPLGAMAVSDLFIGLYDWKLMAVVYASFLVYGILGMAAGKQKQPGKIFLAALTGSLVFYLATNAAVWIFSPWYPHDFQGFLLSYTLALPFFKMTLLGDVFYAAVFFGGYEAAVSIGNSIARKRSISLRT